MVARGRAPGIALASGDGSRSRRSRRGSSLQSRPHADTHNLASSVLARRPSTSGSRFRRSGTTKVAIRNEPDPKRTAVPSARPLENHRGHRADTGLGQTLAERPRRGSPPGRSARRSHGRRARPVPNGRRPRRSRQRDSGLRRDRLEVARDRAGSRHGDRPVPRVSRRDSAAIGGLGLAVGAPRERDALAQRATEQPIAPHATLRLAIPLDLHGHPASRQKRPCPALQVGPQQGLGPVRLGLAALDHSQAKALPTLADVPLLVDDLQVVDQEIALLGPLPGHHEMRPGPGLHARGEPIDADRQDGGLGDASLDRVDRRIPRGRIAEHQAWETDSDGTIPPDRRRRSRPRTPSIGAVDSLSDDGIGLPGKGDDHKGPPGDR